MRKVASVLACAGVALTVAGCATHQTGPNRPITIADDVALMKVLAQPQPDELLSFYRADAAKQAAMRNQIVTARMYIADMEYNLYEARLTKEIQEEGLLATAASLGLTTSATLIPVAQTKTLLSGLATGVTGLDKGYNEKILLSNTIQALQTQMRADRKTRAGVIYAKMLKDTDNTKTPTPIAEYTLPMALSDVDAYYQAGTISSALIGLSRTLANADKSADDAKTISGPNPGAVADVKMTAAPASSPTPVSFTRTPANRDANYQRLLGLMVPGGKRNPDIDKYVEGLLGTPAVQADSILNDQTKYGPLYAKISSCIVAKNTGRPCPTGALQRFR